MDKQHFDEILQKLPVPFKSKLERIRRYLQLGKASVMVGAGFSRNADSPLHVKIKQWNDVGEDIYCRLNNVDKPDIAKLEFRTPMRLASQFAANFGRSELDNLIRDAIPDDRLQPGNLHRQLLNLPWRDIFTTNYDTLLERAREGIVRTYSVVTSKEMLLYKESPRIVKLHGSFPDKTPFLMTEEDFRTYPDKHPEFVNTVRQALVESIFCLTGFSGDDPNFTSWLGWLRDVMGDYAGPSYLITCDEDYDESFKTLMRQRGIEVLNFSVIEGLTHYTTLDFVFSYLEERDPDWTGSVSYDIRNVDAKDLVDKMRNIRFAYPGWFILPKKFYKSFDDMRYSFPYLEQAMKSLDEKHREPLLYELDWRANISLTYKDFNWYRECLEHLIDSYADKPLSNEAISLAVSLLRLYRHHPEKSTEANVLQKRLWNILPQMTGHQTNMFYYTVACNALSQLDYNSVERVLSEWSLSPSNYEGVIYKSSVLAEVSSLSDATKLLSEALERITQSLTQSASREELSLRCVIENMLAFYSGTRMPDKELRFSFIEQRDFILRQLFNPTKETFEITHNFGVGTESRHWNTSSGIIPDLLFVYRYFLLCEAYGFPLGLADRTVDEKELVQLVPRLSGYGIPYALGIIIRSGSRNVAVAYASRKTFNTLNREQADSLATLLLNVAGQHSSFEGAKTRREKEVLLPFLSRLSASCSSEVVVRIFRFAHQIYQKSNMCKREDVNIIYSCVLPSAIQDVYSEVFASNVHLDIHGNDMPLPQSGYEYYKPGDKELEIINATLNSSDNQLQESAIQRAELLLKSNVNAQQKADIERLVRSWRATAPASFYCRHSFTFVSLLPDERTILSKMVKDDINKLKNSDYKYNKSSEVISSLSHDLQNVTILASFLNKAQIKAVIEKLTFVLEENLDAFSRDDSKEIFGGLRNFTTQVFKLVDEFVYNVIKCGFDDQNSCRKLFKVLEKYIPSHLPVLRTMEHLNTIVHAYTNNKMRDVIVAQILSDNEADVIDSCEALIAFAQHSNAIQKVIQNIVFYCNYGEAGRTRLYLQTLMHIPFTKLSQVTQTQLANMLGNVLEHAPQRNFTEEQKVDIMHDGVCLAASLKNIAHGTPIEAVINAWGEYANNEEVYNDIRRPWFVE